MLGGFKETSHDAVIVGPLAGREGVMNPLSQGEIFLPEIGLSRDLYGDDRLAVVVRAGEGFEVEYPRCSSLEARDRDREVDVPPFAIWRGEGIAERIEQVAESFRFNCVEVSRRNALVPC